jgi:hypothetical protein
VRHRVVRCCCRAVTQKPEWFLHWMLDPKVPLQFYSMHTCLLRVTATEYRDSAEDILKLDALC